MAVLSRRSLFRAAVASLGAVAVGEALPGPARADVTAPTAPSLPRPRRPVSTLGGADAPAEAGAGLPAVLTPRALAPAGSATAETDPLVVRALPAPRVAVTAALPNRAFARLDFELRTACGWPGWPGSC
jgi:hypothetical protein